MMGKTLKSQLTLIALLPMLITLFFISVLVFQQLRTNLDDVLDTRANDISVAAARMSEFYLYTGDISGLNQITTTLLKIEGLNYIKFIDPDKRLLLNRGSEFTNSVIYQYPVYSSQVDVDDFGLENNDTGAEMLGYIEMGLSPTRSENKRFHSYQNMLIIAILSLLFGTLLVLIFSRKLKEAINDLIQTAKSIRQGNYEERCHENGTGELLEFQRIFNTMADNFVQSEQELKAKIDSATASLSITIDELSQKNIALDQSRHATIELERSKAISDERGRIMKDMHDGIGGQLIASLALLEEQKDSDLKENIRLILTECLDDLRLIINSLNIANDSLAALLADFKFRMNKRLKHMHLKLNWHVDDIADSVTIPPQMSLHMLRIMQEAFTNILKHANATEINFELLDINGVISLVISDNGQFDPDNLNRNGIGMTSMESRASQINADIRIQQTESGGCQVKLDIPKSKLIIRPPAIEG